MEQILIIAIVGVLMCVVIKEKNAQISLLLALTTGILIFISICKPLQELIEILRETATIAGVKEGYFSIVLKIIGISYLAQIGSQLCKDAGEGAIAVKVELAGKVLIMSTAIPVLTSVLDIVLGFV